MTAATLTQCPKCYGTGRNKRGGPCSTCKSSGHVSGVAKVGAVFGIAGAAMLGLVFWGFAALIIIAIGIAIVEASGPIGAATFGILAFGTLFLLARSLRRSG